ncbi:MAG: hypothetical protein CM1200mP2_25690 [Planctomycetaceae bacterium]|nr:MAG: hypothetical protein CM1200mP2_25690 [Planctomycetaceae bacterium]
MKQVELAGTTASTNDLQELVKARKSAGQPPIDIQANAVAVAGLEELSEFGIRCELKDHRVNPGRDHGTGNQRRSPQPAQARRLPDITTLDLRDTSITDDGLDHVVRLSQSLERLNLTGTDITDDGLSTITR